MFAALAVSLLLAHPAAAQPAPSGSDTTHAGRSPSGAFWRSAVAPGWGQWYNGRPIKAASYSGLIVVCAGMAARNWDRAIGTDGPGSLFWSGKAWTQGRDNWLILGGAVYLFCIVDAYVDAHLQTFDVSPLAVRLLPDPGGGIVIMATLQLPDGK